MTNGHAPATRTDDAPITSAGLWADADRPLEQASALPVEAYVSPDLYRAEVDRIFRHEWLCAGRVDQIPEPGDYFTLNLLDERLVVCRDKQGAIHALSRICRHRSAEVVTGTGNAAAFTCPYHAWVYRLDGTLTGAPLMQGAEGFDKRQCRLPELKTEVWQGWIFVTFDADAAPLGPQLAPLTERLAAYHLDDMVASEPMVFESPFNWKVLVDNFMEAYHHIAIHRESFEPIFHAKDSHVPDNDGPYSLLVMPGQEAPPSTLPSLPDLDADERRTLYAGVVFPMHLFALSDHSAAWYQLLPERYDRFTLRIYTCLPRRVHDDPAYAEARAEMRELTRHIHHEDIGACDAVWAGLRTPLARQGRLSPLEKSLWQFNQWWLARMAATETRS